MLVLDTYIPICALHGSLAKHKRRQLEKEPWSVSAIVLWELAMLHRLGRVELDIGTVEFARQITAVHVWPINLPVCRALRALDFQGDPADELIAATSLAHGVPLLTRDRRMLRSRVVPLADR